MRDLLGLLRVLALASMVLLLAGAGDGRESSATPDERAQTERDTPVQRWHDGAPHRAITLEAADFLVDGEDAQPDLAGTVALALLPLPAPQTWTRACASETRIAPSRIALPTGLPRGPPV